MKTMKLLTVIVVGAIMGGTLVLADEAGPMRKPAKLKSGERAELISPEHFQILGTQFGPQSIMDIEGILGHAEMYDKGGMALGICYASTDGIFLEYYFTDESVGFNVTRSPDASVPREQCTPLKLHSSAMTTKRGLALGLTRTRIDQMLGPPSHRSPDQALYRYIYWVQQQPSEAIAARYRQTHSLPPEVEVWMDVYSVIKIRFEDDKVVGYDLHTVESF